MPLVADPVELMVTIGHKFEKSFTLSDVDGNPVSFIGQKAKLQAKAGDTLIFTLASDAIVKDGTITLGNGTISLYMTGTVTGGLTAVPKAEYDFVLYTDSDDPYALFGGFVGFREPITSV